MSGIFSRQEKLFFKMKPKDEILRKAAEIITPFYRKKDAFVPGKTKIGVGAPIYDEKEVLHVLDSLLSGWVSQGKNVITFESEFAKYTGKKYGIAVNSGSSANLIAVASLIESKKIAKRSEVIVPATTFPTAVTPFIQLGLKPVFVDVDAKTFNIDPIEIEKALSEETSLILPAHFLGFPADMKAIMKIAQEKKCIVMEDCAEAQGGLYGNKKVGSFGIISTYSFFVAHNMTTGEGGMITTDSEELANYARSLRAFGRACSCPICTFAQGKGCSLNRFDFDDPILKKYDRRQIFLYLGYSVKMIEMVASFGLEQLKKMDAFNKARRENAGYYITNLSKFSKFLQIPSLDSCETSSYYGFPIVIKKNAPFTREKLIRFLEDSKIETRPFFGGCLVDQPAFRNQEIRVVGKLPVSRFVRDNGFFIGCHPGITEDARAFVVKKFEEFCKEY
jgi:CDP-6-deoxy-D-xylo-4-hexulose-3-dehydrase